MALLAQPAPMQGPANRFAQPRQPRPMGAMGGGAMPGAPGAIPQQRMLGGPRIAAARQRQQRQPRMAMANARAAATQPGAPPAAATRNPNPNRQSGVVYNQGAPAANAPPYGTGSGQSPTPYRGARGQGREKGLQRYTNQVLADQVRQGLDPGILTGRYQAATQAAMDSRQAMADAFGRTGDRSGYDTGTQAGMNMALSNQMAGIYPAWLEERQNYINDLLFKIRGTRKGASAPAASGAGGGSNMGAIMSGIGGLGSAAAQMYSSGMFGGRTAAPSTGSTGTPGTPL